MAVAEIKKEKKKKKSCNLYMERYIDNISNIFDVEGGRPGALSCLRAATPLSPETQRAREKKKKKRGKLLFCFFFIYIE